MELTQMERELIIDFVPEAIANLKRQVEAGLYPSSELKSALEGVKRILAWNRERKNYEEL
ncbi:hypothetical protein AAVH_22664 [Aphelenchoides avenae]|nr:hypothetical protein AAVH_22664 [Aphelenchus avenae]